MKSMHDYMRFNAAQSPSESPTLRSSCRRSAPPSNDKRNAGKDACNSETSLEAPGAGDLRQRAH
ncbi:hypothetical protein PF003_g8315 [Phytophthora fragariae]|nr:hypothetical protein PF003_g8315 [Phytophthora fragariae]